MTEPDDKLEALEAHIELSEETLKQHVSAFMQIVQIMIDVLGEDFVKSLIDRDKPEL